MNIFMLIFPYWKIIKEDWKYLSVTQWDLSYWVLNIFILILILSLLLWQYSVGIFSIIFLWLFIFSKYKGTSFLGGADIPFIVSLIFLWILYWNTQLILMILSSTIIPYFLLYYLTRTRLISKNSKQILLYINKTGEVDSLLENWVDLTTYQNQSDIENKKIKNESLVLFKKLLKRIPFLPYLIFFNLTIIVLTIWTKIMNLLK